MLLGYRFEGVMIAFGFVFMHPFVDGNGGMYRYLIHHVLLGKEYVPKGMIFPVSSIILERLDEYRRGLIANLVKQLCDTIIFVVRPYCANED